jgi:hypothetical protein
MNYFYQRIFLAVFKNCLEVVCWDYSSYTILFGIVFMPNLKKLCMNTWLPLSSFSKINLFDLFGSFSFDELYFHNIRQSLKIYQLFNFKLKRAFYYNTFGLECSKVSVCSLELALGVFEHSFSASISCCFFCLSNSLFSSLVRSSSGDVLQLEELRIV